MPKVPHPYEVSKWQMGHRKWFLNTNLFLIKPFLVAKFDSIIQILISLHTHKICKPFLSMNWKNEIGTYVVNGFVCDFENLLALLLIRRFSPKADPTTNFLLSYWLAAGHLGIRWLEKRPFIKYVSCTSALFFIIFCTTLPRGSTFV